MYLKNIEKMTFITKQGTYCYKVMPFGLKNVGETFQRMMNHVFFGLIGSQVKVYVEDLMVKSKSVSQHPRHLIEVFAILQHYNIKLNPAKCTFGVTSGRFLGHLVTCKGIEANLDQIKAIHNMKIPISYKKVQELTRKIVALSRFTSCSPKGANPYLLCFEKRKVCSGMTSAHRPLSNLKNI